MIFGDATSTSPGAVSVFGYAIAVSRWTDAAADEEQALPTFGDFAVDDRLRFREAFIGSSVVGMSHAKIDLAVGETRDSMSVEACGTVLKRGDRVLIGSYTTADRLDSGVNWFWAGYCVALNMTIGEKESVSYRLLGPEWLWGGGQGAGALKVVRGQLRRRGSAEAAWLASPATVTTAPGGIINVEAEATIFNPGGRANMTKKDVNPLIADKPSRIFETPDRLVESNPVAERWTVSHAAKYLLRVYNDVATTFIENPDFDEWGIPAGLTLRQTNVDSSGLWAALQRVMAPDWAFYVNPKPAGMNWEGFAVVVFSRNTGDAANVHLDARGTLRDEATACVTRLDLHSDISKTVSKVRVFGRKYRHISIRYKGHNTTTGSPLALQHGWTKADADFATYDGDEAGTFPSGYTKRKEITEFTIDKRGKTAEWGERYTTGGKLFEKYRHVFRLFVWNEAGEWFKQGGTAPNIPQYGTPTGPNTPTNLNWWIPDVGLLWDDTGNAARRRRRMVDTQYKDPAKVDGFRRVRPILLMAYYRPAPVDDLSAWFRVPMGKWQLDPERCAVWFTAEDLAVWRPFDREQNEDEGLPNDDRTFATLLRQGVLRLALEGCIEEDTAEFYAPTRPADAGTPFYSETVSRMGSEIIKITPYPGDDGFIFEGDAATVDDTADAEAVGDQLASAGKDAQVHASLLVAADWPRQPIGSTISTIAGRGIPLLTGAGGLTGRPAQIVALRMDADANKWELLTESAAVALKSAERRAAAMEHDRAAARRAAERQHPTRPTQGQIGGGK